jgi:hypothetical protein
VASLAERDRVAFYQDQLDHNALDIERFEQEPAGDVDGDPTDTDDIAALQDALAGERALRPVLHCGGPLISGVSASMTAAVLRTLLTTLGSSIKSLRVLAAPVARADPDAPLEIPLNEMLTDVEMAAAAATSARKLLPTSRGSQECCHQREEVLRRVLARHR